MTVLVLGAELVIGVQHSYIINVISLIDFLDWLAQDTYLSIAVAERTRVGHYLWIVFFKLFLH